MSRSVAVPLFRAGNFTLHSGGKSTFKIDCDALTWDDWHALALLAVERLPPFGIVVSVPTGGIRFAEAIERVADKNRCQIGSNSLPTLICDDVLTTGNSMEATRVHLGNACSSVIGVVVFARGPCPAWVTPLFVSGDVFARGAKTPV